MVRTACLLRIRAYYTTMRTGPAVAIPGPIDAIAGKLGRGRCAICGAKPNIVDRVNLNHYASVTRAAVLPIRRMKGVSPS